MHRRLQTLPSRPAGPDFFSMQVSKARRFYLDLNPSPSIRLAVVSGGSEQCASDYVINRTNFPFFSIEYVADGEGTLVLREEKHKLMPGSLFTYGPRIKHVIRTDPARPLVKYFVDFAGKEAEKLFRGGPLVLGGVAQTTSPGEVLAILDDIIRNGLKGTVYSPRICVALLQQLVLKINETASQGSIHSLAFATYQRCHRHITERHLELRSLEQIAAECHVDRSYICRLFRRYDQASPYQYLMRLKMNVAVEKLLQPGVLIRNVADELQFSDPFHFSRTFRSVFGVSPRKFLTLNQR